MGATPESRLCSVRRCQKLGLWNAALQGRQAAETGGRSDKMKTRVETKIEAGSINIMTSTELVGFEDCVRRLEP